MRFYGSLFFVLIFVTSGCFATEVSFRAGVDKLEIAFEEKILLELTVSISDPNVRTEPILPPRIDGLTIGGSGSSVERSGDLIIRKYIYDLIPQHSGLITIPAFQLEFQDSGVVDTLFSEPIRVTVAEPLPAAGEKSSGIFYYGLIIVVILLGAAWWYRRGAKAKLPMEPDWREEYLKEYDEIVKLAERQDYGSFSDRAIKLIGSLLERKYNTRLAGYTSADLIKFLEDKEIDDSQLQLFKDLYEFCEGVKFSSGGVDSEQGSKAAKRFAKTVELLLE